MLKAAPPPLILDSTFKRPATLQNLRVTVRLSVAFVCKSLVKLRQRRNPDDELRQGFCSMQEGDGRSAGSSRQRPNRKPRLPRRGK